jgi:hypothetical protein
MADEAFALSPISARANLPSEEDYDAIREAFMETSRGRWFLGEYAKRNRNADTRMVLDAVARIEDTIAAQKQPPPAPDNGLADALAAIRIALEEARAAASSTIDELALEPKLAPVRKSIRVIREISWRWREIGADGRICDLIDSQVSAIEGACGQISSADPKDALSAAFDLIEGRIGEFAERDAAPQPTARVAPSPTPPPADEMPAGPVDPIDAFRTARTTDEAEVATSASARPIETAIATNEAFDVTDQAVEVSGEVADVTAEATEMTAEAAAYDEALLDMVALEMATPDPADDDEFSEIEAAETDLGEPPADFERVAQTPEPVATPQPVAVQAPLQPSLQPVLEPSPERAVKPSHEPSLGSTILANGIVQWPNASIADPLAPIRRMSQAEKIAFFS